MPPPSARPRRVRRPMESSPARTKSCDPRKSAVLDGAFGPRRQIEHQHVCFAPLDRREDLAEESKLLRGAPRMWRTHRAPWTRTREHSTPGSANPSRRPRSRFWFVGAPSSSSRGTNNASWRPAMRACEGPLKSALRMATRSPRARRAPARCSVNLYSCQLLLCPSQRPRDGGRRRARR